MSTWALTPIAWRRCESIELVLQNTREGKCVLHGSVASSERDSRRRSCRNVGRDSAGTQPKLGNRRERRAVQAKRISRRISAHHQRRLFPRNWNSAEEGAGFYGTR